MPKGADLLTVQMQNGTPVLWAQVDPSAEIEARNITVVGTGWIDYIRSGWTYVGSYQDGGLVWHVYDQGES